MRRGAGRLLPTLHVVPRVYQPALGLSLAGLERRIELVEAKVAELIRLGAGVERRTRHDDPEDPIYYAVMHDPEANEFCVG
jgi:hypothetical protein